MQTIQETLAAMTGVWKGTYTILAADGTVVERFASRQEGLLDGTDWTEKVVYLREGQEPVVQYFHAVVDGNHVQFQNDTMWGKTARAGEQGIVFQFGWKASPSEEIIEVSVPRGDHRTRIWRHLEDDQLTKVTVINEQRDLTEQPERWFTSPA